MRFLLTRTINSAPLIKPCNGPGEGLHLGSINSKNALLVMMLTLSWPVINILIENPKKQNK